ncbi:hypothetical protein PHLCEN_2v8500 [Hermanssonia centrifuga]|uniref:Uncharacterized protein n=1 Tax=Hermanssonia centrifuga TaxID=98765 RepID=A0A2R6NTI8_9APHY|nr:hypothetical protein PHLCEN_2v8500 [Hermanssonia centrifuga]
MPPTHIGYKPLLTDPCSESSPEEALSDQPYSERRCPWYRRTIVLWAVIAMQSAIVLALVAHYEAGSQSSCARETLLYCKARCAPYVH